MNLTDLIISRMMEKRANSLNKEASPFTDDIKSGMNAIGNKAYGFIDNLWHQGKRTAQRGMDIMKHNYNNSYLKKMQEYYTGKGLSPRFTRPGLDFELEMNKPIHEVPERIPDFNNMSYDDYWQWAHPAHRVKRSVPGVLSRNESKSSRNIIADAAARGRIPRIQQKYDTSYRPQSEMADDIYANTRQWALDNQDLLRSQAHQIMRDTASIPSALEPTLRLNGRYTE